MEKKRGILYLLRVVVCILAIGLMFLRFTKGLKACALDPVQLTPAQTLALYGSTINGLLYTDYNAQSYTSIQFQAAFVLDDIGFMSDGGGFSNSRWAENPSSNEYNTLTSDYIKNYISNTNAIVYVASASQWGGTAIQPYTYTEEPVNIQLHSPLSINVSDIGGYQSYFMLCTKRNSFTQYPRTPANQNKLKALTSIANIDFGMLIGGSYAGQSLPARALLPTYAYYQDGNPLDENALGYFNGWYVDLYDEPDYSEPFDVTGFTLDSWCVSSVTSQSNDLWLVVGCPMLYGYVPPVVTTTEAPQTYPTQTFPTGTYPTGTSYDPHKIIIDNQNTQIMQLNLIIGQLDRIYNRMVNSGQIAVNLMPAEPLAELRTDIHSQIHDNLTSFTTSRMPDEVSNGFSFFNDLYSLFTSGPLAFFGWIGIFSLMSLVISWFIFRGRG